MIEFLPQGGTKNQAESTAENENENRRTVSRKREYIAGGRAEVKTFALSTLPRRRLARHLCTIAVSGRSARLGGAALPPECTSEEEN